MTTSDSESTGGWAPIRLFRDAFQEFLADRAIRLGAGLAYYGLVTLVPILVLIIGLLGLLVGEEAANGQLYRELSQRLGAETAQAIVDLVLAADVTGSFTVLTVASIVALLFTASILFVAWKDALEVIWDVGVEPGMKQTLANRLFGLAALGLIAALLIALFVIETLLAALAGIFSDEALVDLALRAATSVAPVVLGGVLVAVSYRYGSGGRASWGSIWRGTILTMVLLAILLWGYGVYADLRTSSVAGVASSLFVLLILIYLIAQVLLFGAELIKVLDVWRSDDS